MGRTVRADAMSGSDRGAQEDAEPSETALVELFRRVAGSVPAYQAFLRNHDVDPAAVRTAAEIRSLPLLTKDNYLRAYPLPQLCRGGRLVAGDLIAVSSGSTGQPTFWPRSVADEVGVVARFEQVFRDAFGAAQRSTLAVVCFPLGTWVGGLYTLSCVRQLAARGYPITAVAPGNNKAEILRVVPELGRHVDQVALLGYPPFVKEVIDTGLVAGVDWSRYSIKLVLAGEVFSEEWRDLVGARAGMSRSCFDSASLYGTADAGVLGNETPLSVTIRRFLAGPISRRNCSAGRGCQHLCSTTRDSGSSRLTTTGRCCSPPTTPSRSSATTSRTRAASSATTSCSGSATSTGSTHWPSWPAWRAPRHACRSAMCSAARSTRCRISARTCTPRM
ncbi:MAG TPA: hypothetical protein VGJ95_20740 [Pseudonocardiaceae bacterium]